MSTKSLIIVAALLGLTACQSTPSAEITGVEVQGSWHIESAQGQPVIDYSPAQLIFAADGTLSGNNSCNEFFGQYQLEGSRLTLSPAGHTMKACVDALMHQEQRVMQAMEQITLAQESKGKLVLKDDNGKIQLVLSKK